MTTAPTSLPHHPRTNPAWLAGVILIVLIGGLDHLRIVPRDRTAGSGSEDSGVAGTRVRRVYASRSLAARIAGTGSIQYWGSPSYLPRQSSGICSISGG
jgi:hypothetical protein